ncbi:hypothetical protein TNCV_3472311 [Trichonephila clavipes]|nr:hypothetical protein TNCV_3472311 [Trichonephila clavipes]
MVERNVPEHSKSMTLSEPLTRLEVCGSWCDNFAPEGRERLCSACSKRVDLALCQLMSCVVVTSDDTITARIENFLKKLETMACSLSSNVGRKQH